MFWDVYLMCVSTLHKQVTSQGQCTEINAGCGKRNRFGGSSGSKSGGNGKGVLGRTDTTQR